MNHLKTTLFACTLIAITGNVANADGQRWQNPNPGIVHPNVAYKGKTAGEWTTAWWEWVDGAEGSMQMFDSTGEFAHVNNNGEDGVFFLAKSWTQDENENYGVPQERHVSVPAGTPLYVPVMGLRTFRLAETLDVDALWDDLNADIPNSRDFSVTINGTPVAALEDGNHYYLNYTDLVPVAHPVTGEPWVAAGYEFSFIIKPLPPGNHVIEMSAKGGDGFESNVVYYITVERETRCQQQRRWNPWKGHWTSRACERRSRGRGLRR